MIGRTISHYRILSELGRGAMSVVYVAEDIRLGRQVAFKVLTDKLDYPQFRARMLREARIISSVNHPRIATIHKYGETPEGQPYIVMELVKGKTVRELLSGDVLTLDCLLRIVEGVVEGLAEAHRRWIVHRDIKPSNVAIDERGEVKILDFGLAKYVGPEGVAPNDDPEGRGGLATQTREGVLVGTPMYASPEQTLGADVDTRSDIFSLGSLLYECVAGRPAFEGKSNAAISIKVIRDDPPPPSQFNPAVPPQLDAITLKALAKKVEDRYQSAEELLDDVRSLRASMSPSTGKDIVVQVPRPAAPRPSLRLTAWSETLRRPRTLAAVFLTTSAAALILAWNFASFRPGPPLVPPEAAAHYERGENALRGGMVYLAVQELEQALKIEEQNPLAHARLAEAWNELDNSDNVQREAGRAVVLSSRRSGLPEAESLRLQAINLGVSNDPAGAVKKYETLTGIVAEGERADAYVDLGRAYEKNEEANKALDAYKKAAELAPPRPAAFLRLGVIYGRRQNLASASEAFERAEALYRAEGNYHGLSEVFYQRGSLYNRLKMNAEARSSLQFALDTARATRDPHQQIKALLELCVVSYAEVDVGRARQYAADALALAESNSLGALVAQVHLEVGNAALVGRELDEAEEHFRQAMVWAQRQGGRRNLARASFRLASLYEQRAMADEVLRYVEPALEFYKNGGYYKEYSDGLRLGGRARLQKGDFAGASQAFDEAVRLARRTDNLSQVAAVHFEFGNLLANRELYPAALNHFNESCALYGTNATEQVQYAYCLLYRADMQWRLGLYADADASLHQLSSVIDLLEDKNEKKLRARAHLIRSHMTLSQQRFSDAITESRTAIAVAQGGVAEYVFLEAHTSLGLALSRSGAEDVGLRACRKALALAEKEDEPRLRFSALLALAEAKLAAGDARGALLDATRAQEYFARNGQNESEWRAGMIAAQAAERGGDATAAHSHLQRAAGVFSQLADSWGVKEFSAYKSRKDVQSLTRQL